MAESSVKVSRRATERKREINLKKIKNDRILVGRIRIDAEKTIITATKETHKNEYQNLMIFFKTIATYRTVHFT